MTDPPKPRDAVLVRSWLERRLEASRLDQARADQRGYENRDDFGKAAAQEWSCRALMRRRTTTRHRCCKPAMICPLRTCAVRFVGV